MNRVKYSNDYKVEAVKLVLEQGLTANQAAKDLGVKPTTFHTWLSLAKEGLLDPKSSKREELAEVKRLKKELHLVKKERDILKKARVQKRSLE